MSRFTLFVLVLVLTLILLGTGAVDRSLAAPIGSSFTFQGYLEESGAPANGLYDFQFELYDDPSGGAQAGPTLQRDDVDVVAGRFDVTLDFGDVFDGTALWLHIGVRPGASGGTFTTLSPRQPVSAAPYALYGTDADRLDGVDSSGFLSTSGGTVNGNLGLGVAPQERLDVNGDIRITQPFVNAHDWLVGATADSVSGHGWFFVQDLDAGEYRLLIDQETGDVGVDGNLGVGIFVAGTPMSHRLTVQTESGNDDALRLIGPDGSFGHGARLNFGDSDYVYLDEDLDDRLTIYASGRTAIMGGNLGVGTTSPAQRLHVAGYAVVDGRLGVGTTSPAQRLHVAGVARFDVGGGEISVTTPGGWPGIIAYSPLGNRREFVFRDDRMQILVSPDGNPSPNDNGIIVTAGGNVGIGTYGPGARLEASATSGDLLRLSNPSAATGPLVFRVNGSGQVYADGAYHCGLSSSSTCLQAGQGADVAERINVSEAVSAGDVVELDPDHPGQFRPARSAYSRMVVGIISTAPAITLGNNFDPAADEWQDERPLLALAGRVPVRASAENGAIRPGDLLVSATEPGAAMRCESRIRCAGAIVGRALEPLDEGTGLILVLVALQ